MTERAYTVSEIDALREACDKRWLFGTTYFEDGNSGMSRGYTELERVKCVEEMVRTYMAAGAIAEAIYEADKPK